MFSIKNFGFTALLATMLVGCVAFDDKDILVGESDSASATKIINSSRSAEAGKLLIKFNEKATLALESAKSNDITRSNIEPLNMALTNIGATSIERLFTVDPRHEERTRQMGLHRWYVVCFDSEEQLEKAGKALAEVAEVDIVQYNSTLSYQPSAVIEAEMPTTRLAVDAVNDPYFKDQWHYYNTGSGIHEKRGAGMDVSVKEA